MNNNVKFDRPIPDLEDSLLRPYFRALRDHKLVAQHCEQCGHWQWPAREFCFQCHGSDLAWEEVQQSGTVYTYTVTYRAFHPWFQDQLPYGVAVVDLGNGIRMMANYFGSDVESLDCGQRMKAFFEKVNDDITLFTWIRED